MPIIFNEKLYAEKLLKKGFSDYINYADLIILSKYFRHQGFKRSKIKKSIVDFWKEFNPYYSEVIVGEKIDAAIKKSKKYPLRASPPVEITKNEVKNIRAIKNYKYEKIAFIMLVISRANKRAYNSKSPRYYVSYNFSEILRMANIQATKNERNHINHQLYLLGIAKAPDPNQKSHINKTNMFELLFIDENSSCEIIVDDFDNIISFYKQKCIKCGAEMPPQKKRLRQICKECQEIKTRKDANKRKKKFRTKK